MCKKDVIKVLPGGGEEVAQWRQDGANERVCQERTPGPTEREAAGLKETKR